MTDAALRLTTDAPEPTPAGCRPYLNHVPAWAMRDPAVISPPKGAKLRASTAQNLLRAMADSGDLDDAGNIINILGGKNLTTAAAMGDRTVERYITHLVDAGVVVVLSRGGVVPTGRWGKAQSVANVYGIPAAPRALDHRKVKRRDQAMKPTDELDRNGRTKYVADVVAPGDQTTLWPSKRARPDEAGYGEPGTHRIGPKQQLPDQQSSSGDNLSASPNGGAGVAPPGRGGSAPGAHPPSPIPSPARGFKHNHRARSRGGASAQGSVVARDASSRGGSKASSRKAKRKPKVNDAAGRSLVLADLRDLRRLMPIHARCVELGILTNDPVDRLRFVAAAVSALKVIEKGKQGNPCAVFARNVNQGRWLLITEGDEQTAQRLLVDYDRAQDRASRPPAPPKPPKPPLSHDAQVLAAALQVSRTDGRDAFTILRETKAWSRERYDQASQEIKNRPWN